MKNREEWSRKGEAVTAEMVAKARDKHLAQMERQASMRGPLIREMKAAVLSMRTPQKQSDMFRQASFRHLCTEPHSTETIAMPQHGYRRQPPRQKTPNRNLRSALSIGSAERNALRQYRQNHPSSKMDVSLRSSGGSVSSENAAAAKIASAHPLDPAPPPPRTSAPPSMGMRKPERRGSIRGFDMNA